MKHYLLYLCLVCTEIFAQTPLRQYEIGATMLSINTEGRRERNFLPQSPKQIQAIHGLFFRYNRQKTSFRLQANYSENYQTVIPSLIWVESFGGDIKTKDIGVGAGFQRQLLKQKDWLYAYGDLSYHYISGNGSYALNSARSYKRSYSFSTNAVQVVFGMGCRFKLTDFMFLSPELGTSRMAGWAKYSQSDPFKGNTSSYRFRTGNSIPLQLRIHLTMKF